MAREIIYDAVQFTYPGQEPVWVPVAEAFAFADGQEKMWGASLVEWHFEGETEQSVSFAKSWWFGLGGKMARIGSGAYGDGLVIERNQVCAGCGVERRFASVSLHAQFCNSDEWEVK